jgi:L-lactate dehydrogenase complex protein LldG
MVEEEPQGGSPMSDARFTVLDTIRRQLAIDPDIQAELAESPEKAYARIPRTYQRSAVLPRDEVLELFYDRLRDYDSELIFTDESGISDAVATAMQAANESLLLVPAGVPQTWLPTRGIGVLRDEALTTPALDQPHVVLTGCTVAIAMSGTIVLEHGPQQGRRVATLLPDHHICVLWRDQVVETLAEALQRITHRTAPITTIAGPSATSDIEMTRIRGVHGPRRLTAIIL